MLRRNQAARRAFSDAMAACQAEIQSVAKNRENRQTSSKYADLAAIYSACKPTIAKHGFSFSTFPASTERAGHMGVRWTLSAAFLHDLSKHHSRANKHLTDPVAIGIAHDTIPPLVRFRTIHVF